MFAACLNGVLLRSDLRASLRGLGEGLQLGDHALALLQRVAAAGRLLLCARQRAVQLVQLRVPALRITKTGSDRVLEHSTRVSSCALTLLGDAAVMQPKQA